MTQEFPDPSNGGTDTLPQPTSPPTPWTAPAAPSQPSAPAPDPAPPSFDWGAFVDEQATHISQIERAWMGQLSQLEHRPKIRAAIANCEAMIARLRDIDGSLGG